MRRIFSTVLVLMLVLRGLLGDAMAMGIMPVVMHHQPQAESMEHAGHAMHDAEGSMAMQQHHDMMKTAASAAAAASDHCTDSGSSKHLGGSCSACDICNSSLHTAAELVLDTAQVPQSLHIERSTRFVSAQPAQVAKPPIF